MVGLSMAGSWCSEKGSKEKDFQLVRCQKEGHLTYDVKEKYMI